MKAMWMTAVGGPEVLELREMTTPLHDRGRLQAEDLVRDLGAERIIEYPNEDFVAAVNA